MSHPPFSLPLLEDEVSPCSSGARAPLCRPVSLLSIFPPDLRLSFLLFLILHPLTTKIFKVLPKVIKLDFVPPSSFLAFTSGPLETDLFSVFCFSLAFIFWLLLHHSIYLFSPKSQGLPGSLKLVESIHPVTLDLSVHLTIFITHSVFRICPTFVFVILHVFTSCLFDLSLCISFVGFLTSAYPSMMLLF